MESLHGRTSRARGGGMHETTSGGRQAHSRNKHWVAGESGQRSGSSTPHNDGERWERGGHRGGRGARGSSRGVRGHFPNAPARTHRNMEGANNHHTPAVEEHIEEEIEEPEDRPLETVEDREKFYQELVKARELEKKKAIAEGKMDDPLVPKRLEDAITIVGTCLDMCPRFERYRRERENNLFEWEVIKGTKRVDHRRAVKMYERAAGDKSLPSDIRPPHILKSTLDYLFHDLIPRGGFAPTAAFIRDRSRAVRNDFTLQHFVGPLAFECHDRCARFHILALHLVRDYPGFSMTLEEQQLMNTLQSLKELYNDQRSVYESPTELEMRVYHRLAHIRDQKERYDDIPEHITSHPVFKLTTDFRLHVQKRSAPISKTSALIVDAEAMELFKELANVLREQGRTLMCYLVACILEWQFGKDAIEDIEAIRGGMTIMDIIDGIGHTDDTVEEGAVEENEVEGFDDGMEDELEEIHSTEDALPQPAPLQASATQWLSSTFGSKPTASAFGPLHGLAETPTLAPKPVSAFSTLATTPNVFNTPSPFGNSVFSASSNSVFPPPPATSAFGVPMPSATVGVGVDVPPIGTFTSSNPPTPVPPIPTPAEIMTPHTSFASVAPTRPSFFAFGNQPNTSTVNTTSSPFGAPPPPSATTFTPSILGKLSAPLMNGSSNAAESEVSSLNSQAPAFSLKPADFPSPSRLGGMYQRSSNLSPNSIPPTTGAPPTPAAISASPSSSSSFPPSIRKLSPPPTLSQQTSATPPFLPKINTNTGGSSITRNQFGTPTIPPVLPKHQPISLPSTPTLNIPQPSSLVGFLKNTLDTSTSNIGNDILSPLYLPSPTTSGHLIVHNFSPRRPLKATKTISEHTTSPPDGKGEASLKTFDNSILEEPSEELYAQAISFSQRSYLVKKCLERWKRITTDRAIWVEACRRSNSYNRKVQREGHLRTPLSGEKRRKLSDHELNNSVQKKRAKRRSDYQPRHTDEELAQRFKENHEEHERRWAQGSFLQVIKTHTDTGSLNPAWRIWLSMNPESDATAIWLERKFDVPESGQWASESIFSIPVAAIDNRTGSGFPGIIFFECTPLEGVTDELERKYRILDDCSRLRDIVKSLPPERYFIPSVLIVSWADVDKSQASSDFIDMVDKLVKESLIQSYFVLSITSTTKDLDGKLAEALNTLSLDLEGMLVRSLNIRGAFKLFEPSFTSFISEWIENCSTNGYFDWDLFGQIIKVVLTVLNGITRHVLDFISVDSYDLFPTFNRDGLTDSGSTYDLVITWLSSSGLGGNADSTARSLQSRRDIGQIFPAREFVEHLWSLAQSQTEANVLRDSQSKFYVSDSKITSSLEQYELSFQSHKSSLGQALNMSVRRSPKRRGISEETDLTESQTPKRRRLSMSVESNISPTSSPYLNGRNTPSPTNTTTSLAASEAPVVTIAMLRALTRDMKKKYSGS